MLRFRSAVLLLLSLPATAFAQGQSQVVPAAHHDTSPPLREMPPGPRYFGALEAEPVRHIPSKRNPHSGPDPVLQAPATGLSALAASAPLVNVDGIGNGFTGPSGTFTVQYAPPDTNAAVGPNHIVETVNVDFAVFNKSGIPVYGPVPTNTLWTGFGGNCAIQNDGDPIVAYDRIADRWIITQFQVSTQPYQQCVAISTSPDPTGSYYRYAFNYPNVFPDYPKLGVWPDGYYISYNVFNTAGTAFLYSKACAFDRAKMLTGAAATQQCFNTSSSYGGLLPGDLDGTRLPAAGAPNPFVALGVSNDDLAFWKFHVDWTTPANTTFTGPTAVTIPAYTAACNGGTCIPQSGGGSLDSLADRLMYRAAYRNFGSYETLVVNHAIAAGSSVGVRWYELRAVTTSPQLFQSGTFAPDASYRWMGSMAMDQSGNIAVGYSVSSSSMKPAIRYSGRLASDPTGTLTQGEGTIIQGAGAQGSSLSRWGDYSSLQIDPVDDCTFWFASEYLPANGVWNWRTRIASFKLSPCGSSQDFSLSASPSSVNAAPGGQATSTITVNPVGGFTGGVTLSVSNGLPTGASASFSPNPTTSTSVLTINAGTAAAGTYPLTITGTSGSLTHTTTVNFTVNPSPDFSLSASPSSLTVAQGSSGQSTISVTPLNGFNGQVTLSVTMPAGSSAGFNPVTTATSSVLTITVADLAPGSHSLTVTGVSGGLTRTVPITLTVPTPNFSLTASPSTVTVASQGSGTTTITVNKTNGFSSPVTLGVTSGLPSGAGASFSPNPTTSTSVLTLNAGTAAPGTYTLTVSGTGGGLTRTATVTFVVTAPGGFSISASPSSRTVSKKSSTTFAITITRTGGFSGVVTLGVTGMKGGVTGSFNPSSTNGTSSTLTLTTSAKASRGTVTLTITGTSAGLPTATTTVTLTVN